MLYLLIFVVLLMAELIYFRLADKCNIIDKPNQRSSHSKVVLRGGGVIFLVGTWVWSCLYGFQYPWMLAAVTLAAGISFVDDIHSLPDSLRLVAQFVAMGLMFYQLDILHLDMWWIVLLALIVCVGATNIINFMDGVNGITGGYSLAVLVPLLLMNRKIQFMESSFLIVAILSVVVFCLFNFRPKNRAKCFAGDVGSIGIGFYLIVLYREIGDTDRRYNSGVFSVVYGVDGCLTICHRIMLHENLGEAHRKHAYQLMANELNMSHPVVSLVYMVLQLAVSLVMVYALPDRVLVHWVYLGIVIALLAVVYLLFMRKYYHLHERYLESLKK